MSFKKTCNRCEECIPTDATNTKFWCKKNGCELGDLDTINKNASWCEVGSSDEGELLRDQFNNW